MIPIVVLGSGLGTWSFWSVNFCRSSRILERCHQRISSSEIVIGNFLLQGINDLVIGATPYISSIFLTKSPIGIEYENRVIKLSYIDQGAPCGMFPFTYLSLVFCIFLDISNFYCRVIWLVNKDSESGIGGNVQDRLTVSFTDRDQL